ncbi:M15 family metallopeptidase [Kamptonema sp. UHCC 0994]|uniref:M15 family metallopeptidase n=1 Tax=Kamptonema sp. UHCC 0994 TaxID=3031329 RepID=UPI0023B906E8|nr:M15 family metallopeptidase [Kamptonema sp. UHCC 0994]MDF0554234.1 M15 family metallopeptidase [Kamptonema sp. UHCC 0994]
MKPYQKIPIIDCNEPLIAIPLELFAIEIPHAYQKLGAPYPPSKADSPYYLRQGVLNSLIAAQTYLQQKHPELKIMIFDAYRPVEVQQFMVDYTFTEIAKSQGYKLPISEEKRQDILEQVYQFWAVPSLDPATPPPHSTGAALDVTIVDRNHQRIDMGSAIDEVSPRSYPDRFANSNSVVEQQYHQNRQLLKEAMFAAGFKQHFNEWWHFSLGDQMWAWLKNKEDNSHQFVARYGRVNAE